MQSIERKHDVWPFAWNERRGHMLVKFLRRLVEMERMQNAHEYDLECMLDRSLRRESRFQMIVSNAWNDIGLYRGRL